MYNAKAEATFSTLEALDAELIIVREARPIDLACMFLIVDKMHAIHGWDAFLDVYGNPSIFLELPPATGEQMARVYDALAKRIIGDGRGTVPNGSKFQTVETRQNNCDSFEKRAKWCADAIITVATGGLLTVKAESGSGTLAGSAHTDSFENLVAGSAASISATINKQFTRRLLAEAFPNDPPLAYFSLAPEPADERMRLAQLLATLKTAGWQPTQEKVAELMQMEVEPVPAAPTTAPNESVHPHTQPLVNRSSGLQPAEDTDTAEPPLNEGELEALRFLGAGLNPEQVAEDAEYTAKHLRLTIDPSSPIGYAEAGDLRVEHSAAAPQDEESPEEEEELTTNAARRFYNRDLKGRFKALGFHRKGGRSSRGKKLLGKTGSPNLIEAGDSKRKTKRALVKAFLKAKDGKKVSTGYKMGSHEVTLAPGDKEHWGRDHAERKEHPGKISSDKLAEMTLHGERKNERDNKVTIRKDGNILVFAPENQPTRKKGEPLQPKKEKDKLVGQNWYKTGGK